MNSSSSVRLAASGQRRRSAARQLVRATPVATAVAALLCGAGPVLAQDKSADQTVTVTGIRRGIESAISVKKNADSIVEAISAEDIGKLPDTSIAESIARLPGLTAQRVNGRATSISVRGFAPDFSTALLNGREQVSTGDSRYVEFDQYPSELISGVTVFKAPTASLIGQGLSATIDLKTIRPLELSSRAFAVNYRKEKLNTGLSTDSGSGNRFNISYVDQFADRTLGVAVGYARLKETSGVTTNYGSWGVNDVCQPQIASNDPSVKNSQCPGASVKAPGGFQDLVDLKEQKREALMATLQYRPNKMFQSVLDIFYTKFDVSQLEQGVQVPLAPKFTDWGQAYGGSALTVDKLTNGVATDGTISVFKGLSRNDADANHDKVHSYGWNNKLNLGDWTGELDLATSDAKRQAAHLETTAGLAGNCKLDPAACGTIKWTGFDGSSVASAKYTATPSLGDLSVMKLTDVEGWGGNLANGGSTTPQAGYSKLPFTDDKLNQYRVGAKRALPEGLFFTDVDFGFNYSDRKKTRTYVEGRLLLGAANEPFAAKPVPGATVSTAPVTGLPYIAWNPDGSVGSVYSIASKLVSDIANKNWLVTEKVATAYGRLEIDNNLLGLPVRGNFGVQIVNTKQSSTAFGTDGSNCPADVCNLKDNTDGRTYTDFLPSLNLNADLGSGQTLRLGLGRQLARPVLNDMRASLNFKLDSGKGILTGDAGNPQLKPFLATALDLSYEKYFGNKAYFSAAAFYKKLNTYIIKEIRQFDFSPYVGSTTPVPQSGDKLGFLTQSVNRSGGRVDGVELAASLPFSLATDWLEGFGIQASYSYTDSSVELPITGFTVNNISSLTIPLPGLSKRVDSVALYYERYGFSARIAQRRRSNFVGNTPNDFGDNALVFIKAERIVDAQLGYEFQSGPAKGLSLLLQVNNMNNAPYIEYNKSPSDETKRVTYGKTILFGLNYKL